MLKICPNTVVLQEGQQTDQLERAPEKLQQLRLEAQLQATQSRRNLALVPHHRHGRRPRNTPGDQSNPCRPRPASAAADEAATAPGISSAGRGQNPSLSMTVNSRQIVLRPASESWAKCLG